MKTINRRDLMRLVGCKSPVTIDNWERQGLLPPRIRVGRNRVLWNLESVEKMLAERPTGIGATVEIATAPHAPACPPPDDRRCVHVRENGARCLKWASKQSPIQKCATHDTTSDSEHVHERQRETIEV